MSYDTVRSSLNVYGYHHFPGRRIGLPVKPRWAAGWQAPRRYPHPGSEHDLYHPSGNLDLAIDLADGRAQYYHSLP